MVPAINTTTTLRASSPARTISRTAWNVRRSTSPRAQAAKVRSAKSWNSGPRPDASVPVVKPSTKGVKRNYEAIPVSDEDAAFVRGLVIHEDAAVLAFNKPAGLPVQTRDPDDKTLDRLLAAFARSNGKRPRLVHRLDAQTSGVIIAGKTQPAAAVLSQAFATRDVSKTYLAIVSGAAFDGSSGEINAELTRHIARPGLELMRAARPGDQKRQSALTRWRVVSS